VHLLSPAVGYYSDPPRPGERLSPGSRGGTLTVLGREIDLLVPQSAGGRVVEVRVPQRLAPVSYAQPLLVLLAQDARTAATSEAADRAEAASQSAAAGEAEAGGRSVGEELAGGDYALRATTAGVFYGRPDASSPPFAPLGSTLEAGQTAGLIEVMKCFSPILHPGGTIPSPALVHEVRVRDGEEVHPGQVLIVLRRAP